jgi:hypothetical protein
MKSKARKVFHSYAIVDRYDAPYMSDSCICEDRDVMADTVKELNDPFFRHERQRAPYRVVKLYYLTTRRIRP